MSCIEFPRYSIYLIPDNNFRQTVLNFYKENNNLKNDFESLAKHGLNIVIKSPFYIDHLDNEKKLISSFLNLKKEIIIPNTIKFNKLSYNIIIHRNYLRLKLNKNNSFDFFSYQVLRRYDEFRKVLNPDDYQKDISRFGKLTEQQIINYQIWGYPYLFDEYSYHISIIKFLGKDQKSLKKLSFNFNNILQNYSVLNLSKIAIGKQSRENEAFDTLVSIDL
ncbi:DUF1045 domain-containing protein [Alphaproteobacteria bacterium]|nr:DUF1045 domain-containing protein [Alphaproteobacteria bacterium]